MELLDSKLFRYRYDFPAKQLKEFIEERYMPLSGDQELEEILATRIRLNGEPVSNQTIINPGDWLEYLHLRDDEGEVEFQFTTLYEDDHILAISKPDFLPVTPSRQYYFNSLAIWVKEKFLNEELTPLHRLDIETSGVLLFGKQKKERRALQTMFEYKQIEKFYQAIVFNRSEKEQIAGNMVPAEGSKIYTKQILIPSDEPTSETIIHKWEAWGDYSRVWVQPITGKTNQIRVHLASIGCPIVGDKKYYPDEQVYLNWFKYRDIDRILPQVKLPRQALHCHKLTFQNPINEQWTSVEDTTPAWQQTIDKLI